MRMRFGTAVNVRNFNGVWQLHNPEEKCLASGIDHYPAQQIALSSQRAVIIVDQAS